MIKISHEDTKAQRIYELKKLRAFVAENKK